MALRPDRNEVVTDISFFMNEAAERGVIVTAATQGSGAAMDDSSAAVNIANAVGDKPVGLLLNDVVDLDATTAQYRENFIKSPPVNQTSRGQSSVNFLKSFFDPFYCDYCKCGVGIFVL